MALKYSSLWERFGGWGWCFNEELCCRVMKSEKYSKNTRRVYQCCEFTNTIINYFANNRLLTEPPEEANAPPIPEKLQM